VSERENLAERDITQKAECMRAARQRFFLRHRDVVHAFRPETKDFFSDTEHENYLLTQHYGFLEQRLI
jgi:hypothetical protein